MNNEKRDCQEREQLLRLAAGGIFSAAFYASVQLGVFTKLKNNTPHIDDLSPLLELPPPSARVLAQILCVMGLLQRRGSTMAISPLVRRFLDEKQDAADLFLYINNPGFGPACEEFVNRLRDPKPLDWYQIRDEEEGIPTQFFTNPELQNRRMHWGMELAAEYSFAGHRTLMDIGGASGGWCIGIRKLFPHLQCLIFDLPQVTRITDHMVAAAAESDNIRTLSGSFFDQDLPDGADVILLANILHDWNRSDDKRILQKVRKALPSGGVLLVSEFYFEDDWSAGVDAASQAYSVLGSGSQSGWQPSYADMEELLREEGFTSIRRQHKLVIGRKP